MEDKEIAMMDKLWVEKSKNGSMPSYQMSMLLPQIRKNFEVDEEAVDELVTELDKEENGLINEDDYKKVCKHFLVAK
ncbi:hypothetical protein HA402_011104 [Bradysia odoriphaga]|nr:hypothetical protein HA402_011104 [Bradysia odoriphaga]